MTRYYINMNDGRVIAGTDETKDNICYREIDISWAIAIRDGKVTKEKVVEMVNAKVGMVPYSEWTKGIEKLNVRSRDLQMVEHARSGQGDDQQGEGKPSGVIGAFKEQRGSRTTKEEKEAAEKAAAEKAAAEKAAAEKAAAEKAAAEKAAAERAAAATGVAEGGENAGNKMKVNV